MFGFDVVTPGFSILKMEAIFSSETSVKFYQITLQMPLFIVTPVTTTDETFITASALLAQGIDAFPSSRNILIYVSGPRFDLPSQSQWQQYCHVTE
jgi:hypothetical protein